jgi:hypothetical protein
MPRKSFHDHLDQLHAQTTAERVKARDLEAKLEAAKLAVEDTSRAITAGYEAENDRAVRAARRKLQSAEADAADLGHQVTAAALRVERAQRELDRFQREHARNLLDEREQASRTVAADLTAAVHEVVRLAAAYRAERQMQDRLVAKVAGASPRVDGPAAAHAWERQLRDLERAVSEVPELPAPLPSWWGLDNRRTENATARRLQLQRHKTKTADEAAELDKINRDLGVSAPRAGVV